LFGEIRVQTLTEEADGSADRAVVEVRRFYRFHSMTLEIARKLEQMVLVLRIVVQCFAAVEFVPVVEPELAELQKQQSQMPESAAAAEYQSWIHSNYQNSLKFVEFRQRSTVRSTVQQSQLPVVVQLQRHLVELTDPLALYAIEILLAELNEKVTHHQFMFLLIYAVISAVLPAGTYLSTGRLEFLGLVHVELISG
jgi:DNA-binding GntR family transcriptional regulator